MSLFKWEALSKRKDNACAIENALLSSPFKNVRPEDIRRLCDACRRMVLRDVDVRENRPRTSKLPYDYGKTPYAMMYCVTFIRAKLATHGVLLVRAKEVMEYYCEVVKSTGEAWKAYQTSSSVMKILCRPLALSNIHYRTAVRKFGSFFCTVEKFDELCRPTPTLKPHFICSRSLGDAKQTEAPV